MAQTIVIGAGLLGLTSAYYLLERGHAVTVLERRDGPGLETSFANAGMLTPSMADPWNAPGVHRNLLKWLGRDDAPMLLRWRALPSLAAWGLQFLRHSTPARFHANLRANHALARYSLAAIGELRAREHIEYDASTAGTMKVFRDARALEHSAAISAVLAADGLRCRRLDATGVVRAEPQLAAVAADIAGGLLYPDDESGDAHRFCSALAALLQRRGAVLRYGDEVCGLLLRSGRIGGVRLRDGVVSAEHVVVAAGSHSPDLLRDSGVRLPVKPVKGYSLTLATQGVELPGMPVVDDALHAAVTPLGNRLRIAGTAEFAGFDRSIAPGRTANLLDLFARIYPRLSAGVASQRFEAWAGLRPVSPDGVPAIGATRLPGLYLNTGHGHLGWTMAAGSGKLLADLLTGNRADVDPAPYNPLRFST